MKTLSPKLPLTKDERVSLRRYKVRIKDIRRMDPLSVSNVLGCTLERAQSLCALASFQRVPSIGPKAAQWMLDLGYHSLDEITHENGADLVNRLEAQYGYWMDPCVEDALRCIVHHATHPGSEKRWFDFTDERKTYRQKYGYPVGRPALAWYDVD